MSEGEEKQNDTSEEEFQFYFSFTKPLVLDLPTEEDRALAAAWVQKLEAKPQTEEEKKDRLNYLKLLLFVLQRGQLSGIFARQPPSGALQPLPQELNVLQLGNLMLEQDGDVLYGGGDAGHIPYVMELSNDLTEYVASQEVPNFGIQMYYAWSSNEPVHKWSLFDEAKFPEYILEKIKQIKSPNEKSLPSMGICKTDKKGCNLPFPELSPKNVKSPEEIENSLGRSFLTYMGLAGRMGNFNEKCDENSERFSPRQNSPRKGSTKRKSFPESGVGQEGQEEFDVFVNALGGELNSTHRSCLCPDPIPQGNCPTPQPKKRPQSSFVENTPVNNCPENAQWASSGFNRGQGYDSNMSGMISQQRNGSRNTSSNRRNMECAPEGNSGRFQNQGEVCICSSPPCTCPCPRSPRKSPVQKGGSPANGGRICQSPSRTSPRSPRQEAVDCNMNRSRGIGTHLTTFEAPDPCTPSPRPNISPTGGRTSEENENLRPVLHCYDNQNPDPTLTKTVEKNDNWFPVGTGRVKYMDTDFKTAAMREQMIERARENKCTVNSRRQIFNDSQQAGPSGLNRSRQDNNYSHSSYNSSSLLTHPLCDYSPPPEEEGYSQQCPQNYSEFQSGRESQMYPNYSGRPSSINQKKTQAQSPRRPKSGGQTPGPFAIKNDTGRLANLSSALMGLKQKTEAHREKCGDTSRPPPTDSCYTGGVHGQSQSKSFSRQTEQRSPRGRGFCEDNNESMSRNMMSNACGGFQAPPSSPQGQRFNFQNNVSDFGNYSLPSGRNFGDSGLPPEAYDFSVCKSMQDECDPCEDGDDDDENDCDSSGSMEDQYQKSEECMEALSRRSQDYYKLTFEEQRNLESQGCKQDNNFSPVYENQYAGLPSTQLDLFRTMPPENAPNSGNQCTPQGRVQMKSQTPSTSRGYKTVLNESRGVSPERTDPGRGCERMSRLNATPTGQFDESCNQSPIPQGTRRNRYMEASDIAIRTGQYSRPVCSTPLRHHRGGFIDEGADDMSNINR